jgi:Tfp pilus assembly protein PilX
MKHPISRRRAPRGVATVVVLMLLAVMLLGGVALARMTEVGTLAAGNAAYREAAQQASEIGLNTAFDAVKTLANEGAATGGWYTPAELPKDKNGLPVVDWEAVPYIAVGATEVRYVVERACTTASVTYPLHQCLVRQEPNPPCNNSDCEPLEPKNSRQYRITVRVSDRKGTKTFVQSLVTRG